MPKYNNFFKNKDGEKVLLDDKKILIAGWARDGLSEKQISHNMGISYTTLKDWKKKYPALRIGEFELAPKGKADYQFVLEGLRRLKDDGTAVYVLPCGILFRAAKEGTIRKQLIDGNYIDAVIGLPAKLFDVTGIPVALLVLKRKRTNTDILFIDASHEFKKGKNKNELTPENCDKIIKAYHDRKDMDKYAHVAPLSEVKENDYNMNIPRYVDTFDPEPEVDIDKVMQDIIKDDTEIAKAQHQLYNSISQMVGTTPDARKEQADLIELLNG